MATIWWLPVTEPETDIAEPVRLEPVLFQLTSGPYPEDGADAMAPALSELNYHELNSTGS